MSRLIKNALLISFVGFLTTIQSFAQGGATGALTGTVQDPSGAFVPNAEIRIINQDTGVVTRDTKTDDSGSFTAPLLPVGTYTVQISGAGFGQGKFSDVVVRVSDRRILQSVLASLAVPVDSMGAVYGIIDKLERTPPEVSAEKLLS
ncbi:MAG: carboxypeptidase regulatory-like domain-containing protein, partial [Acidobacteriaceae bacterium]